MASTCGKHFLLFTNIFAFFGAFPLGIAVDSVFARHTHKHILTHTYTHALAHWAHRNESGTKFATLFLRVDSTKRGQKSERERCPFWGLFSVCRYLAGQCLFHSVIFHFFLLCGSVKIAYKFSVAYFAGELMKSANKDSLARNLTMY